MGTLFYYWERAVEGLGTVVDDEFHASFFSKTLTGGGDGQI